MKYLVIILFAFAAISAVAQEKKQVQEIKAISVEKNAVTKTLTKENKAIYVSGGTKSTQPKKTIEYYDNLIVTLKSKINYIKSVQSENEKAIESGWFIEMNQNVINAESSRNELLNKK